MKMGIGKRQFWLQDRSTDFIFVNIKYLLLLIVLNDDFVGLLCALQSTSTNKTIINFCAALKKIPKHVRRLLQNSSIFQLHICTKSKLLLNASVKQTSNTLNAEDMRIQTLQWFAKQTNKQKNHKTYV